MSSNCEAAEAVCHDEQMTVWTADIVDSLSMGGYFRERLSYDDGLNIHAVIARDLRDIITTALAESERKRVEDRRCAATLAEAVWDALDDMGADGHSVCPATKAKARVAYEPFRWTDENDNDGLDMPLEAALAILADCGLASTPSQETTNAQG